MSSRELLVVHCVDAEGPLDESICATFERIKYIFGLDMDPSESNLEKIQTGAITTGDAVADTQMLVAFSKSVLKYNRNWSDVHEMNQTIFSEGFRFRRLDDFGNPWKISWFCLDHVNYKSNPRNKEIGFGAIHKYYAELVSSHPLYGDELQWHYHPKALNQNPIAAATSYTNSMPEIIEILSRRVIEEGWFPTVYRPGFHSERTDANLFLEQWFPFDYGNQFYENEDLQPDMHEGRFGNWANAPSTWRGYHPDLHEYDQPGTCRRLIFRCLNLGTRLRILNANHVNQAFNEAQQTGCAILAFTDHDFRDIAPDIEHLQNMILKEKSKFPEVKIRYCTAQEAAQRLLGELNYKIEISAKLSDKKLTVKVEKGEIFGSQPFLAILTKSGEYLHDNLDRSRTLNQWSYTLDDQTILLDEITTIGIATSGKYGGNSVIRVDT